MKDLKLALITPRLDSSAGGLLFSVSSLGRAILRNTDTVPHIFAPGDYSEEELKQWDPLTISTSTIQFFEDYRLATGLSVILSEFKPNIIHSNGIWTYTSLVVGLLAYRKKIPYVVSPRGMLSSKALTISAWKKRLVSFVYEKKFLEKASCLHALNPVEVKQFRDYGLRQPICVIPNGVDLPLIKQQSISTQNDFKRIVFIGRFHQIKGLLELIRAFAEVWHKNVLVRDCWRLVLAGWDDGGHLVECRNLAAKLGCDSGIEWHGPVFGDKRKPYSVALIGLFWQVIVKQCLWQCWKRGVMEYLHLYPKTVILKQAMPLARQSQQTGFCRTEEYIRESDVNV